MIDNKIDYSKLDISELELWFGKETAQLLSELSNLELKVYNDSVDEIHYYHSNNIPYIQYHVNKHIVSFNEGRIKTKVINNDSYLKVFETLTNIQNVKLNGSFNQEIFNIIDITNQVRTFEDSLLLVNQTIESFNIRTQYDLSYELAFKKLVIIVESLNQGWTPDWTSSNQYKYYPYFRMGGSSGSGFAYNDYDSQYSCSVVASRLCFKSRYLAEYASKQFLSIYKDYMVIQ